MEKVLQLSLIETLEDVKRLTGHLIFHLQAPGLPESKRIQFLSLSTFSFFFQNNFFLNLSTRCQTITLWVPKFLKK